MATLSVKFIKTSQLPHALYLDTKVVSSVSLVGRKVKSTEYDVAYYCRRTKSQPECWVLNRNDHWSVSTLKPNGMFPNCNSYDYVVVSVN